MPSSYLPRHEAHDIRPPWPLRCTVYQLETKVPHKPTLTSSQLAISSSSNAQRAAEVHAGVRSDRIKGWRADDSASHLPLVRSSAVSPLTRCQHSLTVVRVPTVLRPCMQPLRENIDIEAPRVEHAEFRGPDHPICLGLFCPNLPIPIPETPLWNRILGGLLEGFRVHLRLIMEDNSHSGFGLKSIRLGGSNDGRERVMVMWSGFNSRLYPASR